jgi:hypothetical protein
VWRVDAPHRTDGRFEAAHEGLPLTPLVRRHEEMAVLLLARREAREGEGRVVLLGGEPGIGTSLTQVLREQLGGIAAQSLRASAAMVVLLFLTDVRALSLCHFRHGLRRRPMRHGMVPESLPM